MAIHKKTLSLKGLPSVRQLRAFVAVYHGGRLSAAAERLSLTQPAVTVLLRELEEKLGVRLFDRTTRTLRRTEAAEEAIGYAERALAELDAMAARMADVAGARRGSLRIAATSTTAQTLLPRALKRYLDAHPAVRVAIDDCAPGEFVDRIANEQVDFGVGMLEAPTPGLEEKVFVRDHLSAIADVSVPFPNPATVTWRQLAAHPVIAVKPGYGVRGSIDETAAAAGVRLRVVHEVALLTTGLAMAAARLGVAVLPASLLAQAQGDAQLVARRLVRPAVDRHVAVVRKRGRSLSPAAEAFAALLHDEFSAG
jgi:LysR family carnitine catabolism transcriptional activator